MIENKYLLPFLNQFTRFWAKDCWRAIVDKHVDKYVYISPHTKRTCRIIVKRYCTSMLPQNISSQEPRPANYPEDSNGGAFRPLTTVYLELIKSTREFTREDAQIIGRRVARIYRAIAGKEPRIIEQQETEGTFNVFAYQKKFAKIIQSKITAYFNKKQRDSKPVKLKRTRIKRTLREPVDY